MRETGLLKLSVQHLYECHPACDDVDDGLKQVISEIFSDHRLTFKVAAVPVQSSVDDSGLFAVVYATALAFTQDPDDF